MKDECPILFSVRLGSTPTVPQPGPRRSNDFAVAQRDPEGAEDRVVLGFQDGVDGRPCAEHPVESRDVSVSLDVGDQDASDLRRHELEHPAAVVAPLCAFAVFSTSRGQSWLRLSIATGVAARLGTTYHGSRMRHLYRVCSDADSPSRR